MSTVVDPDTGEHTVARADEPPTATEPTTCPNCGAPADPGQLMCLECGSRLALDYQRPPSWRLPAAVVGIVLLIAGIGVAVALAAVTGNADKTTTAPTQAAAVPPQSTPGDTPPTTSSATPAQPTPSTPTPAPPAASGTTTTPATGGATATTPAPAATPASGWPPGKSASTVILASLPSKSDADAKLKAAQAGGISGAAILHSDDFPTLRPGYWVVFDGQYDTIAQAQSQAAADRGKAGFQDAYPRFVSKDPNAKP
jgi:eukaryotic-like serine/threonine-protein kinase